MCVHSNCIVVVWCWTMCLFSCTFYANKKHTSPVMSIISSKPTSLHLALIAGHRCAGVAAVVFVLVRDDVRKRTTVVVVVVCSTCRLACPSCSRPVRPVSVARRVVRQCHFLPSLIVPSFVGSTVRCRCGSARCDVQGEAIFYLRCRVAAGTDTGCLSYLDAAWFAGSGEGAAMIFLVLMGVFLRSPVFLSS